MLYLRCIAIDLYLIFISKYAIDNTYNYNLSNIRFPEKQKSIQ